MQPMPYCWALSEALPYPLEIDKRNRSMRTTFYSSPACLTVAALFTIAAAQQGTGGSTLGASGQTASSATGSSLRAADRKFIREAAEGGMAEVELGQLAVQRAASDDVKNFGQRMADDHGKANDKLKELAASKGITLPQGLNSKQGATKERLAKLSGEQFDQAYMRDMLFDHKKDIAAFRSESTLGRDSEVKNFASTTLPTLQDHLKNAQSVRPKVAQAGGAL
jgi:putative membrane protein